MATAVVLLFWLQRGLTFDGDGFNWIILAGLGSDKTLITPYGGHLILTPLLVFRAILGAAGASYTAFGVVQVALLLLLSGLVYEYGRRRLGPWLALPAAIVVLFLGSSSSTLLQPMLGIQFLCALVPGLAGLLALERGDRRGDLAACLFFSLAVLGFEMGLAFVVGGTVAIALRGNRWRRAWVVAVPFVIYAAWRIWATRYGGSGLELSNLPWIPAYVVDSLGTIAASLFGLFLWPGNGELTNLKLAGFDLKHVGLGVAMLAAEVFVGIVVIRRLIRRRSIPATLWAALAVLATIWLEQGLALAPTRTPGEIRYVFPDTVAFLLVATEFARGTRAGRLALITAATLTVLAVCGNLFRFQEGRDTLIEYSSSARAALAAIEIDGSNMEPTFDPATEAPGAFASGRETYVSPGSLASLDARYGRFGYSVSELLSKPEAARRTADLVAAAGMKLKAVPAQRLAGGCRAVGDGNAIELPRGGALLIAARESTLRLRRFADHYPVQLGRLTPRRPTTVRIPADAVRRTWHAYAPEAGRLTVCPF
jgi:hypothetical protein